MQQSGPAAVEPVALTPAQNDAGVIVQPGEPVFEPVFESVLESTYEPVSFAPDEDPPRRGAPLWMVSFADMITLLLTFFVLILSFSDLNADRFRDVSGSLQNSLGDKDAPFGITLPPVQLVDGPMSPSVSGPEQLARDLGTLQKVLATDLAAKKIQLQVQDARLLVQVPAERSNDMVLPQETLDLYSRIANARATVKTLVEVRRGIGSSLLQEQVERQFVAIRESLAAEIAGGSAQVERNGDRIVVTLSEQGNFYQGSADLSPDFLPLLGKIGRTIAGAGGGVTIEGHTDSVPIARSDRFRSNWDLSGARSAAVADYLTDSAGVARDRVAVRGLADTRPLGSNDTKAGRAKNRRIEIILDSGAL